MDVAPVVGAVGDAHAGVEHGDDAVEGERARERVLEAAGELDHRRAVRDAADQHGELVAAEPRERVAAPDDGAQPHRDVLQQAVAVVVPERVVDLLEAVEVDQQQAGQLAGAAGGGDRVLHPLVEQRAVREAREVVVQREVPQPPRGDGDDPEQRGVEDEQADAEQQVEPERVLADGGRDRLVGAVDLEHAGGPGVEADTDRDVDLEQGPAEAGVLGPVLHVPLDASRERRPHPGRVGMRLTDDAPLVGVDDDPVGVEQLQPLDAEIAELALSQLLVERLEAVERR